MTYRETIASGDYIASLEATRDEIAADLEVCESMRDKAALYMRMSDVLARLEEVKPKEAVGDAIDQLAERRDRRRGPSSGEGRSKRAK